LQKVGSDWRPNGVATGQSDWTVARLQQDLGRVCKQIGELFLDARCARFCSHEQSESIVHGRQSEDATCNVNAMPYL
jgi:hypothetical protein